MTGLVDRIDTGVRWWHRVPLLAGVVAAAIEVQTVDRFIDRVTLVGTVILVVVTLLPLVFRRRSQFRLACRVVGWCLLVIGVGVLLCSPLLLAFSLMFFPPGLAVLAAGISAGQDEPIAPWRAEVPSASAGHRVVIAVAAFSTVVGATWFWRHPSELAQLMTCSAIAAVPIFFRRGTAFRPACLIAGSVLLVAAGVAFSRFGLDPLTNRWAGLYPFITAGVAVIVVGCNTCSQKLTVPLLITGLGIVWQLFAAGV